MTKKYFYIFFGIALFFTIPFFGQQQSNKLWKTADSNDLNPVNLKHRSSIPDDFKVFKLDLMLLKRLLNSAPKRESNILSSTIISFPMSNGKMERFKVYESSIMHPDLQAKYPNIRTYAAQGIDDPTATMRFSVTKFGLHTMTLSGKHNAEYIDPYSENGEYCIVYNRNSIENYRNVVPFECTTDEGYHVSNDYTSNTSNRNDTNDQVLRTYRLAQSCTAEYGNIFTTGNGTDAQNKADIQAQMTITINRVNEIYERDLAITLQFIPNNDVLIYYGSTSADPWSNEWNNTTQTVIDNAIGDANYDIGHNFNTTGGGNAGCLSCVCTTGSKGSGYTGRADPTGDPFDIDYVAHEMGHQFGGYHTMNTCSRSGNGITEVEPASGSSIMGYAGICTTNVQSNSDAHFNYVNIRDISANIQTGNSTCGAQTALANNPPTANAGVDYTIPANTAFVLEGTATDADGMASITYNWSQNDPEQAPSNGSPQSTWTVGPLYRAKLPILSPKRYLPQFTDVRAGNLTPTWEVTPSVSRNMEFSFIVRDNDILGGQTASDLMNVTVDANSGPFTVTSQTNTQVWQVGSTQTITWNVANTNAAPVNATNVDIYLTEDGETLIPVLLNTPNDGVETISVPSGLISTTARIMVKGSNNIFYAINPANITIEAGNFVMNFNQTTISTCTPNDVVYNFTYNITGNFNETVTFSATGSPAGSTVTFNPTQATADGTNVTMSISGLTDAMVGNYSITVTGTSASTTVNTAVNLTVQSGNFTTNSLQAPVNNATDISTGVQFSWTQDTNADSYFIEIADDLNFNNIIDSANVNVNTYNSANLQQGITYYWRVTYSNTCGNFTSPVFNFTTQVSCTYCTSAGNMDYATSITNVTFNAINNTSAKTASYMDYTNIATDVFRNKSHNLTINVNTDGNFKVVTKVWIDWNQDCDFADAGEEYDLGSATNTTNGATSNSPLSILVPNTAALGSTRMRVSAKYTSSSIYPTSCQIGFDGEVEDYTINVKQFNDDCANAKELQTGFVFTDYNIVTTNVGSTASGVPASNTCAGFGNGEDVWYQAIVPESGNLTIEIQSNAGSNLSDTVMSVYSGDCNTLTEITCDDDSGLNLFSIINLTGRNPGEIIFIRVWEYNNNTFDSFQISVYDNPCNNTTTIWDGVTWSNGTPDISTPAIINGNYSNGNLSACELIINKGFIVNVNANQYIQVNGNLQNNGTISILDDGSFVQVDNNAKVSGTGNFNTYINTTPLVDPNRFTYMSAPTVNETLSVFSNWTQMNAIWEFNNSTQHWTLLNGNEVMTTAKGYAVKPNNTLDFTNPIVGNTVFTNKFFNGITTQNLFFNVGQQEPDSNDDDSNLVGNPYPSAIDAALLLSNNPSANAFYFWSHNTPIINGSYGDDYAIWNSSGGITSGSGAPAPSGFIASGQGFFVLASSAGTFTFDNSYRTLLNNDSFIRTNENDSKIWLNVIGEQNEFSQILVSFANEGTIGFDNQYDAPRISLNSAPISFYSFGNTVEKYGIQTRESLVDDVIIPLGYKTTTNISNLFTISIDHLENLSDYYVYLKDNDLNILHDLNQSNYSFYITSIEENNNRFELVLNRNSLAVNDNLYFNNVSVYTNSDEILIQSDKEKISEISLFDLLGKELLQIKTNTTNYRIEKSTINFGVYFIRVHLKNNQIITKKIIIQ